MTCAQCNLHSNGKDHANLNKSIQLEYPKRVSRFVFAVFVWIEYRVTRLEYRQGEQAEL